MAKKKRVGDMPWIGGGKQNDSTDEKEDSKPVKQQDSKTVKKATYYIREDLIKQLKYLSVKLDRDLSDLVNEAIQDLLSKKGDGH